MTKFTSRDIAEFKRTARNVWPLQVKKEKLNAKIKELKVELESIEKQIELKEAYILSVTEGYHVFDIIERKVTALPVANSDGTPKLDDKGEQIINLTTDYVLKYPETVLPIVKSLGGEDFFAENVDDSPNGEVESTAAEATFNPIATVE